MYLGKYNHNGLLYAVLVEYDAGHKSEQETIKTLDMKIGDKFLVDDIDIYGFHTDVYLTDFPNQTFNSVFFDFVDEDGNEVDIYNV